MKKILLFLLFIFAVVYAVHWFSEKNAPAPAPAPATPVIKLATPTPKRRPFDATPFKVRSLDGRVNGVTPDPKLNPLNAPHR